LSFEDERRCDVWEVYLENGRKKEECAGSGRRSAGSA
jgi:hypothetical protein